jgi:Zn-dependent protease
VTEWPEWILSFAALVMAIILHEVSHGYAALALGDDTAKRLGRLSLNPIVHVDRMGTIILPGIFLLAQTLTHFGGGVFFGWAKPVPIAPWRFRDPRRGMMLVALAGPVTNYVLAYLAILMLHVTPLLPDLPRAYTLIFIGFFIMANLALGTFNLLPIPPLDGGRVVVGILPERLAMAWARTERTGIVLVLLLVFVVPPVLAQFGIHANPLADWLHAVGDPIFRAMVAAAGHPQDLFLVLRVLGADGGV